MLKEHRKDRPWLGEAHHVRCFLHMVNLIAQTLLKQFDSPKKNRTDREEENGKDERNDKTDSQRERRWVEDAILADGDNDLEPDQDDNAPIIDDDDTDGWVDEYNGMDNFQREVHSQDIAPLRLALAKVRSLFVMRWHMQSVLVGHWGVGVLG